VNHAGVHALGELVPSVDPAAWLAPTATVVGDVTLLAGASVWYGAVLRGDGDGITIGARSNIQDGCVVHTDRGAPAVVGTGVSVGHRAVLHGCAVGDGALVGMGAVVLNGAEIGAGCLVAAGAVVLEGTRFEPGTLVAGVPAKARRELTEGERARLAANAEVYVGLADRHRRAIG
jgi:carbonic anhydrase/acetyltransferase-like protein (isoleucine patch superfamily)